MRLARSFCANIVPRSEHCVYEIIKCQAPGGLRACARLWSFGGGSSDPAVEPEISSFRRKTGVKTSAPIAITTAPTATPAYKPAESDAAAEGGGAGGGGKSGVSSVNGGATAVEVSKGGGDDLDSAASLTTYPCWSSRGLDEAASWVIRKLALSAAVASVVSPL